MKKFYSLVAFALMSMGAMATAPTLTPTWDFSYSACNAESYNHVNATAVTAEGVVVTTGVMTQETTFGDCKIAPTYAAAGYIAKIDAEGKAAWAVGLDGDAVVNSVSIDNDGCIFAAGALAGEVTFNSTDGNSLTGKGCQSWGEYTTKRNAAFIVKYSATGVAQKIVTFAPSELPIMSQLAEEFVYYFDEPYFKISKITAYNDKVYVSAIYTGNTQVLNAELSGSYVVVESWLASDLSNGSVISFDNNLESVQEEAYMKVAAPTIDVIEEVINANFTISNDVLYPGFVGVGRFNYANGANQGEITFLPDGVTGFNEYGFLLLNNGTKFTDSFINDSTMPSYSIGGMQVIDGKLIVVGTVQESNKPAAGEEAVSTPAKIGAWTLDAATMEGEFNMSKMDYGTSTNADGDVTHPNNATVRSIAVIGDNIIVNAIISSFWQDVLKTDNLWFTDSSFEAAPIAGAGIAASGKIVVSNAYDSETGANKVQSYSADIANAIGSIGVDAAEVISTRYFNLQGQAINAKRGCGMVIKVETLANGKIRSSKAIY